MFPNERKNLAPGPIRQSAQSSIHRTIVSRCLQKDQVKFLASRRVAYDGTRQMPRHFLRHYSPMGGKRKAPAVAVLAGLQALLLRLVIPVGRAAFSFSGQCSRKLQGPVDPSSEFLTVLFRGLGKDDIAFHL